METAIRVTLRLHGALRPHADGKPVVEVPLAADATVADLLDALRDDLPGVERKIRDERGALRPHVNLFVDAEAARGHEGLARRLRDGAEILVLPAVSGG